MDFRVRTEANVGSGGCHRSIVCDCRVRRDLLAARLDAPESAEGTCLSRLVIVSNRVALPGEGAQRSGGLVTGLVDALHQAGGLWFGWSGKLRETAPEPNVFETEGVTYATVDLTHAGTMTATAASPMRRCGPYSTIGLIS